MGVSLRVPFNFPAINITVRQMLRRANIPLTLPVDVVAGCPSANQSGENRLSPPGPRRALRARCADVHGTTMCCEPGL